MKKIEPQFEEFRAVLITDMRELLRENNESLTKTMQFIVSEAVDELAMATKTGFDQVHARIDMVEGSLEDFRKDVAVEFKITHQEITDLRSNMDRQFVQVNKDIQLRKLILD